MEKKVKVHMKDHDWGNGPGHAVEYIEYHPIVWWEKVVQDSAGNRHKFSGNGYATVIAEDWAEA